MAARAAGGAPALGRAPGAAEAFDLTAGAFVLAVARAQLKGERNRHAGCRPGVVEGAVPAVRNRVADEQLTRRADGQLRVRDGAEVSRRALLVPERVERPEKLAAHAESPAPAVRDDLVVDSQQLLPASLVAARRQDGLERQRDRRRVVIPQLDDIPGE